MSSKKLKQLHEDDLKPLRIRLHKEQNHVCPILGRTCKAEEMVVDHQHMTRSEKVGENGAGLVRGVIHFQANSLEGKIANAYKRWGIHKHDISLPQFLRNLADYLEREPLPLIHPTEKPQPKRLGKALFNKINKAYKTKYPKRKPLVYPERKRRGRRKPKPPILTIKWERLMAEFNIKG